MDEAGGVFGLAGTLERDALEIGGLVGFGVIIRPEGDAGGDAAGAGFGSKFPGQADGEAFQAGFAGAVGEPAFHGPAGEDVAHRDDAAARGLELGHQGRVSNSGASTWMRQSWADC